jgi:hypothetical protein
MSDNTTTPWSKHCDDGRFYTAEFVPNREAWRLHQSAHDETPRTRWFKTLDDAKRAAGEAEAHR